MPTTLFRRGRVRTPDRPDATALVVVDGRVAWVGDEPGADGHADVVDAEVDLDGALVLPAFVDAHAHLSHTGMGLRGVDLAGTTSTTEALRAIEDAVRRHGGRPRLRPELAGARLGRGPAADRGRARPGQPSVGWSTPHASTGTPRWCRAPWP